MIQIDFCLVTFEKVRQTTSKYTLQYDKIELLNSRKLLTVKMKKKSFFYPIPALNNICLFASQGGHDLD